MKKTYAFLLLLTALLLGGVSPVLAQDDDLITFEVNAKSGDWTKANPARTWASAWASNSKDPEVTVVNTSGYNNMAFYNGTDIQFYTGIASTISAQSYDIKVSSGYKIMTVSFDFVASNAAGVSVTLGGQEAVENYSTSEAEHCELTDINENQVSFVCATLGTANYFANTSNFIITLAPLSELDKAWVEFHEVLSAYGEHDASEFPTGTQPGQYSEEAVNAYLAAVKAAFDTEDIDPEALTAETLNTLAQALKDTYQGILDSKNLTYSIPSGYYRFRTAMTYINTVDTGEKDADDNPVTEDQELVKYMYAYKSGDAIRVIWGTPEEGDATDAAAIIWRVDATDAVAENGAKIYDIQSGFDKGRFNDVTTSGAVTLSTTSENLMAIEPAMTEDDVTYVNFRVSTQAAGSTLYLHQGSHNNGRGVSGNVVGWSSSYSTTNGPAATEWILEKVEDAEAEAILAAYAPIRAREEFEAAYSTLKDEAVVALNKAKDFIIGEGVITSVDQLSSPYTESSEGSLEALLDGKANTYWHSSWSGGSVPNHTHYLQVELTEGEYDLLQMSITRRPVAADHVTVWSVYGSNDPDAEDDAWVKLATLDTPYGNNTETITAIPFQTQGYQFLRFYIDGTTRNYGYGHISEFQLYEAKVNPTSQYVLMGEVSKNLENVLNEQAEVAIADITEAQATALQEAYDAFMQKYVNPAQLREVIASVENIAAGIIVGSNPGYWKDASVADDLKKAVADAQAYDKAGVYVAEQSDAHISTLTKLGEAVKAAAIGVSTGKWYRIRFTKEEEAEQYGWDNTSGAPIVNDDEVETDEGLWGKFLTAADYEEIDGVNTVQPMEAEDARIGDNLFFDAEEDIEDPDLALFRFVAVGDSAFILQNKATGLFLRSTSGAAAVRHSIHPSLFTVKPIGYGQNVIAAKALDGTGHNNLHAQRLYNLLVTWNANEPGSRSAFFIEEAGDVAADYDGTEFLMDIKAGQLYSLCYPVPLSVTEGEGVLYTVNEAKGTTVTLAPIKGEAAAGRPVIYIMDSPSDYDEEAEANVVAFHHGYEVAAQPDTTYALKGTYETITEVGAGYIIVDQYHPNAFTVTRNLMGGTVNGNTAYIASDEKVQVGSDITIEIPEGAEDGINTAIQNVTRTGVIYTLDGRVTGHGNLNSLSKLGRGVYILNGTKVTVK